MKNERVKEMSRFVVVGILATAIHYAIYYVLLPYMSHNAAFTLGYAVSFLANYVLSSRFTFRVGTSLQRFVGFGLSHATNYFIQIILLNLFIGLGVGERLAPLPVYVLAVPINYLTVRFALTRRSGESDGYWLFLMAVGFAMLLLNLMDVPTLSDDMIYRFAWQTDSTAPVETIDGLGDLLRSQWTHYLTTNGRFVAHLLAQTFLVFVPPVVLQVADTLLFVLLIHLCVEWNNKRETINNKREEKLLVAVVATFLLFVVFQGFGTTMVWGLGAFNYLWPLMAVMALLLLLQRRDVKPVPLALLALVAGWSHEALSLPVSVAFAVWMIANRKRAGMGWQGPFPYMLLFMAGTALCLLSPGVVARAGDGVSLTSRLLHGAINCATNIRVLWLLALTLAVLAWRDRKALNSHLSAHRYEYVALAVAFAIVVLCGTTLERVAFFADFMAMLLLLSLLVRHLSSSVARPLIAVCCVLLLLFYVPAYMVRSENAEAWQLAEGQMKEPGRELIAVRMAQKGEDPLMDYMRGHYVNSSFIFGFYSSYMGFDAEDINMRCAARLYGKERLVFLPEDVVQRMEGDTAAYRSYELDRNQDLYIWRMADDRPVKGVTFLLNEEDPSQLLPHQRLTAYKGNEYELDDFNYKMLHVGGRPYLVFTKPTTNIFRRIRTIRIEH